MDKAAERETHDFMNVESFSQLPFIRPQPPTAKERPGGIKLFGIEFGNTDNNANDNPENLDNSTTAIDEPSNNNKDSDTNADSGRRFECHYCCRNFPTSQALGGHQNAHKRERQHAKRAHLQSAMVHSGLSDPTHVYGFMNYHRLGSSATYPSWNNTNHNNPTISTNSTTTHHNYSTTSNNRFYGSHHHGISSYSQQPINGSPLAFWRIPPVHHHNNPSSTTSAATTTSSFNRDHQLSSSTHHHSLPSFAGGGDIDLKPSSAGNNLSTTSHSSHSRYVYEVKPSMQDHVSLDLHL